MISRRRFTAGVAIALTPLGARASAQEYKAQQAKRLPRIGILLFSDQDRAVIRPCLQELQARGYVDGKTVVIEYRDAEGRYERLPELAGEIARLHPDVIYSFGGEQAPIVKQATQSIPIVVVVSNDPVASGLVASLARPGGNVTGVTYVHDQLAGKAIELLKDAAPRVARVAILWNPNHTDPEYREPSVGPARWALRSSHSRCAAPRNSRSRFRRQPAGVPRRSSSPGRGSCIGIDSRSASSHRRIDCLWWARRHGCSRPELS